MKLIFKNTENNEADVLFYPVNNKKTAIKDLISHLDYDDDVNILKRTVAEKFEGKTGQSFIIHDQDQTIVLLGCGDDKLNQNDWRILAGHMMNYLKKHQASSFGLDLSHWLDKNNQIVEFAQALAEGLHLAAYDFDKYKKGTKENNKIANILYIYSSSKLVKDFKKAWELGISMASGTNFARDLVNEPAGSLTPTFLAKQAQSIARQNKNISVKVFDKVKISKLKMNAFLGIAKGSNEEPKFIHLVYKVQGSKKKVALVGKGITFDSGGLNVKPWQGMIDMKLDMGGAAAVLGVFSVLEKLKPKVEVHGFIAACENMSSGKAIKPGDVVSNMNGKTIEVSHTDAEGRVTLADSLAYAQKQGLKEIVDIATLTGSIIVALGPQYAGIFSNDDKLATDLLNGAEDGGEKLWRMPLAKEYKDANKSKVADIRNIDNMSSAGSITAAWFLNYFIEDKVKWAHIDIAGPAFAEKPFNSYVQGGGVGFGVRTLLNWLKNK